MDIGQKIKEKRISCGMSQMKLSELSGLRQSTISCIEIGTNKPAIDTMILIAKAMNCSVSEIIGDDNKRNNDNLDPQQAEILQLFSSLNRTGKIRALETLQLFTTLPEYQEKDTKKSAI